MPPVAQLASQAHAPRLADRRRRARPPRSSSSTCSCTPSPSRATRRSLSGLDPSQTGKMTSTLSAHGISYELQNNGTAIAVQSNQTRRSARRPRRGRRLLGNTQPGFALFEKQNLGESNFQQQVTYQRALQGQLERDDRQRAGRLGRAGRARPAQRAEPGLRRKPERGLGRRAAVGDHLAGSELGAGASPSSSPPACPGCS